MKRFFAGAFVALFAIALFGCAGGEQPSGGTETGVSAVPPGGFGAAEPTEEEEAQPVEETEQPAPSPGAETKYEPLVFKTGKLKDARENEDYEQKLEAEGGSKKYSWAADNLPDGFKITGSKIKDSDKAAIKAGTYSGIKITLTDKITNESIDNDFTLNVNEGAQPPGSMGKDLGAIKHLWYVFMKSSVEKLSSILSKPFEIKIKEIHVSHDIDKFEPYKISATAIGGKPPYNWTLSQEQKGARWGYVYCKEDDCRKNGSDTCTFTLHEVNTIPQKNEVDDLKRKFIVTAKSSDESEAQGNVYFHTLWRYGHLSDLQIEFCIGRLGEEPVCNAAPPGMQFRFFDCSKDGDRDTIATNYSGKVTPGDSIEGNGTDYFVYKNQNDVNDVCGIYMQIYGVFGPPPSYENMELRFRTPYAYGIYQIGGGYVPLFLDIDLEDYKDDSGSGRKAFWKKTYKSWWTGGSEEREGSPAECAVYKEEPGDD